MAKDEVKWETEESFQDIWTTDKYISVIHETLPKRTTNIKNTKLRLQGKNLRIIYSSIFQLYTDLLR